MKIASVKMWNEARAWGFLRVDGHDVFCHISALPPGTTKLEVGTYVAFEFGLSERNGKPMATNIRLV
ncbi:CspA family cold shock protein [Bradyrhizobium sp. GM0.4]